MKKSIVVAGVLLAVLVAAPNSSAQVPTLPPDGGSRLGSPTCATFDAQGRASTSFGLGEELVVRGRTFAADSLVLVGLGQPPQSWELGRFRTNESGEFTTEPSVVRVPLEAREGAAVIQASSTVSASCEIRLSPMVIAAPPAAGPEEEPEQSGVWFAVWGGLLLLFGAYLGFTTYQTRRRSVLQARPNRGGRPPASPGVRESAPASSSPGHPGPPPSQTPEDPPALPPGWGRPPTPLGGSAAPPSRERAPQ